jgi:uncharacterized iron-regulated membrane protein
LRVHRWLGIGLGLWFALVGLTGALLVFEEPVDAWLNPQLLTHTESAALLAPAAIAARATETFAATHGRVKVERIRLPLAPHEVYRLVLNVTPDRRVGPQRVEAMFAPVSGTLLGSRDPERLSLAAPHLLRTVYEFHRNVLLGNSGANIVGVAGLLLAVSAVSGLVTSWPRRREHWRRWIWINRRASATRISFDAHRSGGVLFALLLLLATLTGSTLVWLNYVRDAVNVVSPVRSFPTIPWRGDTSTSPLTFAQVVDTVTQAWPAHAITEIHGPPQQTGGYLFHLHQRGDVNRLGDTWLWVHPLTAEILVERSDRTRSAGETLMHWFLPLHTGTALGTGGRVAMLLTGLVPLLLVGTGLWVWWRKRRGEALGERRRQSRRQDVTSSTAPGQDHPPTRPSRAISVSAGRPPDRG